MVEIMVKFHQLSNWCITIHVLQQHFSDHHHEIVCCRLCCIILWNFFRNRIIFFLTITVIIFRFTVSFNVRNIAAMHYTIRIHFNHFVFTISNPGRGTCGFGHHRRRIEQLLGYNRRGQTSETDGSRDPDDGNRQPAVAEEGRTWGHGKSSENAECLPSRRLQHVVHRYRRHNQYGLWW